MRKLGAFFNMFEGPKILDVGTGNGNFIRTIQSVYNGYEEIIGIDNIKGAIDSAKEKFEDERISFMEMDAYQMTFEDDVFDVVCLSNSLHHLDDIERLFQELERVLKPGGTILINEMISDSLDARQKAHKMLHHFSAEIDRLFDEPHNETFKAVEILKLLEKVSTLDIKDVWNLAYVRPTGNSQEEIDFLVGTIDRLLKRVEGLKEEKDLIKKGEKIKRYIRRVGFDNATQLVVLLK
jgi:ubiquinone/menaquinone biosynthesis C-methylase UbiE